MFTPLVVGPSTTLDAPRGTVVINEIYYHAPDKNPAVEFVELYNRGAAAVNISGWCIDGVSYCFPAGTGISARGYKVVRATQYRGSLSNSGETVRLYKGAVEYDRVSYDDAGQWPAKADGEAQSLQRRDPTLAGSEPGNWMSAARTTGAANTVRAAGLLPTFSDVKFTRSPSAAQTTQVTGKVRQAAVLALVYRVGFGVERRIGGTIRPDGSFTFNIPRQRAGSLVRFYLAARRGTVNGTWPRQGDGSKYSGTVVRSTGATALTRFQLFMEPSVYQQAYRDLSLDGDEGYEFVFAYDGEIFDRARLRVKGQSSRYYAKKKWKVSLPGGHDWDSPLLRDPVDEFALHAMVTDKSYSREILSWDLMSAAQQIGQQTFPVRMELNGAFYGLYIYIEQPDSDWRERQGFSDDVIAWEANRDASLYRTDAGLSDRSLDSKYERKTQRYIDSDNELRSLIRTLGSLSGASKRAWAYRNIDISQLINAVATVRVMQHYEVGHKNYTVALDPADGKWRWIPQDFDLNFGHYWSTRCGSLCDPIRIIANLNYPSYNALAQVVISDPVFRDMLDRRTRTLTDKFLSTRVLNRRMGGLNREMRPDSEADYSKWGSWGQRQSITTAQTNLLRQYLVPKGRAYRGALPTSQVGAPTVRINRIVNKGSEYIELLNVSSTTHIDISGWTIAEAGVVVPGGVVLRPSGKVFLIREGTRRADLERAQLLALPVIPSALPDSGGRYYLRTGDGLMISGITIGTPPAKTVIVNEYNAVDTDKTLKDGGSDPVFGTAVGNGGNWLELVVISDHTDLRGWKVEVSDKTGEPDQKKATVVIPSDGRLADLRSGTIVTLSDTVATDLIVNPAAGDWHVNIKGTLSTSKTFTQITVRSKSGAVVAGPIGEGVNPESGIGSDEVFQLQETPAAGTTPSAYSDGTTSTFGRPNTWTGGSQNFSVLRSITGPPLPDGVSPTKPTNVRVSTITSAGATVSWTASTDRLHKVTYAVVVDGHVIAFTSRTSIVTKYLFPRMTYRVEIFAVDASGMRSSSSGIVRFTTVSGTVNLGS